MHSLLWFHYQFFRKFCHSQKTITHTKLKIWLPHCLWTLLTQNTPQTPSTPLLASNKHTHSHQLKKWKSINYFLFYHLMHFDCTNPFSSIRLFLHIGFCSTPFHPTVIDCDNNTHTKSKWTYFYNSKTFILKQLWFMQTHDTSKPYKTSKEIITPMDYVLPLYYVFNLKW